MPEPGRISNRQAAFLIVHTVLSTSIILLPGIVYREAHQDAWLSVIIVTIFGIAAGLIIVSLGTRFPRQTIIQYSGSIVGQPLGKIIGLVYIMVFVYVNSFITREITNMFQTSFMPETPQVVFSIGLLLTAAYTVRHGLEVLARVSDIILPLALVMFLIISILIYSEIDSKLFFPLLERGVVPVFKGAYLAALFFSEIIVIIMIIPYLKNPEGIKKNTILAAITVGLFQLVITVAAIGVLGGITAHFNYTTLQLASYISLGRIIERVEPLIMLIWISGGLIKIGVFYYCAVLAMAQWLGLREYKALVLPTGALMTVLSTILWDNTSQLIHQLAYLLPPLLVAVWVGIPLALLMLAWLRNKGETRT